MRASGHTVLITGGGRGIGLALARQFHAAGNRVVLVGRDEPALESAVSAMPGAVFHVADVAKPDDRAGLVRAWGDVSVLVNNAGVQVNGDFGEIPAARLREEIEINLVAPVLLSHAFLPALKAKPEAAIVNVTSVLALTPKQSAVTYCASKAGLHSVSRSLRWQLESSSVRVFELMPPLVETAMTAGRGTGKIAPEAVASAFWGSYLRDDFDIRVGRARVGGMLSRLWPSLAERILRHG